MAGGLTAAMQAAIRVEEGMVAVKAVCSRRFKPIRPSVDRATTCLSVCLTPLLAVASADNRRVPKEE